MVCFSEFVVVFLITIHYFYWLRCLCCIRVSWKNVISNVFAAESRKNMPKYIQNKMNIKFLHKYKIVFDHKQNEVNVIYKKKHDVVTMGVDFARRFSRLHFFFKRSLKIKERQKITLPTEHKVKESNKSPACWHKIDQQGIFSEDWLQRIEIQCRPVFV